MKRTLRSALILLPAAAAALYFLALFARSAALYAYLVDEHKSGWEGLLFRSDDELGFAQRPDARGFYTLTTGERIRTAFDDKGFRIPWTEVPAARRPERTDLLFLGCSFTFGAACEAEDTFPYLVAGRTRLSYINAGVCGYGLAHMLILAERLIPLYRPRIVVVQYSPWLAQRAVSLYTPMARGSLPAPYFSARNGELFIAPPLYRTQLAEIDTLKMKDAYKGRSLAFFLREGIRFWWYEDRNSLITFLRKMTRSYPFPAADTSRLEKYVYDRIIRAALRNGAKVVIVQLGDPAYTNRATELFAGTGVAFANADQALAEVLKKSPSKDYSREFAVRRTVGGRDFLADPHPNPKAHRIIAESVMKAVNELLPRNGKVELHQ